MIGILYIYIYYIYSFLLAWPIFRGELLILGSVDECRTINLSQLGRRKKNRTIRAAQSIRVCSCRVLPRRPFPPQNSSSLPNVAMTKRHCHSNVSTHIKNIKHHPQILQIIKYHHPKSFEIKLFQTPRVVTLQQPLYHKTELIGS